MWLTNFIVAAIYAWLIDTGNPLEAPSMMLFTNEPLEGDGTILIGGLTVPTFTGYAPVASLAFEQYTAANGELYLGTVPAEFNPTNATNLPQTIRGAAIIDGTDVIAIGYFPTPKVLSVADQVMHVTPRFQINREGEIVFEADVI